MDCHKGNFYSFRLVVTATYYTLPTGDYYSNAITGVSRMLLLVSGKFIINLCKPIDVRKYGNHC